MLPRPSGSSCWSRSSAWRPCRWPDSPSAACPAPGSASPSRSGCCSSPGSCGWRPRSRRSRTARRRCSWSSRCSRSPAAWPPRASARWPRGWARPGEGWLARRRAQWIGTRALPAEDPARLRLWLGSEVVFAVAFAAMALLVAYSPDVWGTEKPMDMAFINAVERLGLLPAARPVDGRRGPQLLLPRPPRDGDRDQGRGHGARRRLQPRLRAAGGAVGDRGLHVRRHAVGGRAAAADRRARRAGAGRRDRGRGLHRARQPRRRARVARRRRPARRLRLVRALARDPGDDQRVPVVLVPARRPARARARAAVHRRRARLRAAGRDRRPARRRGAARRRRGAGRRARGRRPVRDQLVVVPDRPPGCWLGRW